MLLAKKTMEFLRDDENKVEKISLTFDFEPQSQYNVPDTKRPTQYRVEIMMDYFDRNNAFHVAMAIIDVGRKMADAAAAGRFGKEHKP